MDDVTNKIVEIKNHTILLNINNHKPIEIIIMGDLNIRTANLNRKYTPLDPSKNIHTDIIPDRKARDMELPSSGKSNRDFFFSKLDELDLYIVNGTTPSDHYGDFTHRKLGDQHKQAFSTVDYALASETLAEKVADFEVIISPGISDHNAIGITLTTTIDTADNNTQQTATPPSNIKINKNYYASLWEQYAENS